MTAENGSTGRRARRWSWSFNEAAADDRGKLAADLDRAAKGVGASMRPRPMTAENRPHRHQRADRRRASMRPRPMTAENTLRYAHVSDHETASMRPRPMTAENRREHVQREPGALVASMRPRPMTAENGAGPAANGHPRRSFNEAAADDRGKRPRSGAPRPGRAGFNEAAADDRGKRRARSRGQPNPVGLQ